MNRPAIARGRAITVVAVATIEEEQAMLAELSQLSATVGTTVAPALDMADLPTRLGRVLSASDSEVRIVTPADLHHAARAGPADPAEHATPDLVVGTAAVPPDLLALAAAMCGVEPRDLADVPGVLSTVTAGRRPRTCLVLIDPEHAELDAVVPPLVAMVEHGVRFGLLYALDPVEARLAILKTLLVNRVHGDGRGSVLYADIDPRAEGGPSMLQYAGTAEGGRRFTSRQDILVVSGHANPLDAALGGEAALCARAGADPATGSDRDFPCFNDGRCFRQPLMGRSPDDRAGLFGVGHTDAGVLILSGCSVAALGKAWFDARHGLAYQAQQRARLACAVTASVAIGRLEFDLLALALIADGMPMGHVVAEINRVRTVIHHQASAYPAGLGPFVLLGNPCLQLSGWDVQEVTARPSGRALAIDLEGVRFDPDGGALLRVPVPPADRAPTCSSPSAPTGCGAAGSGTRAPTER